MPSLFRRRSKTLQELLERKANDPNLPQALRAAYQRALEKWISIPPEERDKQLRRFVEEQGVFRFGQFGEGSSRRPRKGRPPHGARPIPDDSPFISAPRRRARK